MNLGICKTQICSMLAADMEKIDVIGVVTEQSLGEVSLVFPD